jgi:hypothetical protein
MPLAKPVLNMLNPLGCSGWCANCDCPLSSTDLTAGFCTNCGWPINETGRMLDRLMRLLTELYARDKP